MSIVAVNLSNNAWNLFINGSFTAATTAVYTDLIGLWFWVIIWLFLLIVTFIRTEDLAYVFTFGLIGLMAFSSYGLFPYFFRPIAYLLLAVCLMITLYAFFVRNR